MKMDITKAFDKLQWNFLFKALKFFQFSDSWIGMIKELICNTKGSVFPCGLFVSSYGLR